MIASGEDRFKIDKSNGRETAVKAKCNFSARPSKLENRANFISLPLAPKIIVIYTPKGQIHWNISWQGSINSSCHAELPQG